MSAQSITFEGTEYVKPCLAYAYGGCINGKCPNGYEHINFCAHHANNECRDGDNCRRPKAEQITNKNGKVTDKTERFWVIEGETKDFFIVFETKAMIARKQAARQKAEQEEQSRKATELKAKTVYASGTIQNRVTAIPALEREIFAHYKQINTWMNEMKKNPDQVDVLVQMSTKQYKQLSILIDKMTTLERTAAGDLRYGLELLPTAIRDKYQHVLDELPAPKSEDDVEANNH